MLMYFVYTPLFRYPVLRAFLQKRVSKAFCGERTMGVFLVQIKHRIQLGELKYFTDLLLRAAKADGRAFCNAITQE